KMRSGITCKVKGTLEQPPSASNPHAFDYKEYLKMKQIFWILEIEHLSFSQCHSQKTSLFLFFSKLRQDGIMYVKEYFPPRTFPLAVALLFGDRDLIEEELLTSYQKLGIIHLLAISGLHVGLLAGMFYYICIRLGLTREKAVTVLIILLPCYALV